MDGTETSMNETEEFEDSLNAKFDESDDDDEDLWDYYDSVNQIHGERTDYDEDEVDPNILVNLALQRYETLTDSDGYMYVVNRTVRDARYLRCTKYKKGCSGRAIMHGNEMPQRTFPHNHPVDNRRIAVRKFTGALIVEAQRRQGRSLRQIYDEVVARFPEESMYIRYRSAMRAVRRASHKIAMWSFDIPEKNAENSPPKSPTRSFEEKTQPGTSSNIQEIFEEGEEESVEIKVEFDPDCLEYETPINNEALSHPLSELLPGPKDKPMYYDGDGYYYNQTSEDSNQRWLQCAYVGCGIFACMDLYEGAPITLVETGASHNHPPNPERRERICFLHTIKTRHAAEDIPFADIYHQEAQKNPVGASMFSMDKIEQYLKKKPTQNLPSAAGTEHPTPQPKPALSKAKSRTVLEEEPAWKKIKVESGSLMKTSESQPKRLNLLRNSSPSKPAASTISATSVKLEHPTTTFTPDNNDKEVEMVLRLKPSERLPGPHPHSFIYHNGNGHYYKAQSISKNMRHLICIVEGCMAKAFMSLEENSPISMKSQSPAHNHAPQVPAKKLKRSTKKKTSGTKAQGSSTSGENILASGDSEDEAPANRCSEKLKGPEFFYDFKGNYYYTTHVENGERFLRCLVPTCWVEACMSLEDNAEIRPLPNSFPHNHKPDPTGSYANKIKQVEEWWQDCVPSERLPSLSQQYCCYYDGRGYYYCQNSLSDNIRYLTCMEPLCPAKAHMCTQKDAPITLSPLRPPHSHPADPTLRDALLFIDAVRVRARSGTQFDDAISLEASRNPVGADRVDMAMLQTCLKKATELQVPQMGRKSSSTEYEVDFMSCLKPARPLVMTEASETLEHVANHFNSLRPVLGIGDSRNTDHLSSQPEGQKDQRSEKVPSVFCDTWLYHDGHGHYYTSRCISQGRRYLQCVQPKCGVQAWMTLCPGDPIRSTKPHLHGPQPPQHRTYLWFLHKVKVRALQELDKPIKGVYEIEAEKDPEGAALVSEKEVVTVIAKLALHVKGAQDKTEMSSTKHSYHESLHQVSNVPSEKLPGMMFGADCQYHDGKGYYYTMDRHNKTINVMYLKCISPACSGRGLMAGEDDAPITLKSRHNHEPDTHHRELCLFSDALKRRARDEQTPLAIIYAEESRRFPEAASVLTENKVKAKLVKIRRLMKSQFDVPAEGDDVDEEAFCDQQRSQEVSSEVIHGRFQPIYHDGKGYYFLETFSTDCLRYLMCIEPECLALAKMVLVDGAPVVQQLGSPVHNHKPDPLRRIYLHLLDTMRCRVRSDRDCTVEAIYKQETDKEPVVAAQFPKKRTINMLKNLRSPRKGINKNALETGNQVEEEELWLADAPAESLPSPQHHGWVYHDGRGYYFYCQQIDATRSRLTLRCCQEGCDALATMENREDAPVARAPGSTLHNHSPDLDHHKVLLFLHKVVTRAHCQPGSLNAIYIKEAERDPSAASLIPKNKVKGTLNSLTVDKYFKDMDLDENEPDDGMLADSFDEEVTMVKCEMLYSAGSGQLVYSNCKGHYYRELRQSCEKQYLVCLTPLCRAVAYVDQSDPAQLCVPVSSPDHNHQPDLYYRNKLLFIHRLRQRVLDEDTHIDTIYNEEASTEPIGADISDEVATKNMLYKLRKSRNTKDSCEDYILEGLEPTLEDNVGEDVLLENNTVEDNLEEDFCVYLEDVDDEDNNAYNNAGTTDLEDSAACDTEYTEEENLDEDKPRRKMKKTVKNTNQKPPKGQKPNLKKVLWPPESSPATNTIPSEKVPSRSSKVLYHDGMGYYYHFNTIKEKVMYLRCSEPKCQVRSWKYLEPQNSPISLTKDSPVHNHQPNFARRKQLLFIHRCKLRAATENLPLNDIWEFEADRDPETASQVNAVNVKTQMKRYRQEHSTFSPSQKPIAVSNNDGIQTVHNTSVTEFLAGQDFSTTAYIMQDIHHGAVPEVIPSPSSETLWYAAGYFYTVFNIYNNIHKTKCIEASCNAKAHITLVEGEPPSIRLNKNTSHCHPPDTKRREQLLFIDRCKRRAADSFETVHDIYEDEAAKEPEVAALLSAACVRQAMMVAKRAHMKKFNYSIDEIEDSNGTDMNDDEMGVLSEESEVSAEEVQSECLLSQEDGCLVYHDGAGFFYYETCIKDGSRILKCLDCKVRARMRLSPPNAPIIQLDWTKSHTHPRDMNRMNRSSSDRDYSEPPQAPPTSKPRPRFAGKMKQKMREEYVKPKLIESDYGDQSYTDYVTLEEENDSPEDNEVRGDEDPNDPDFEPSPTKSGEKCKLYHDGNGYYYSLQKDRNNRYLKCKSASCMVVVPLGPREKPLLKLFNMSPTHQHPPDDLRRKRNLFLKKASSKTDLNKQDEMEEFNNFDENPEAEDGPKNTKLSELVHGRRPNSFSYHDGDGYYYNSHMVTERYRYVVCVVKSCNARGYMALQPDNAPINLTRQSPPHNHQPDLHYKKFTYFLEKCKMRALQEDTPIKKICDEEAALDPVSAKKILKENLIQRMTRIRSGHTGRKSMLSAGDEHEIMLSGTANEYEEFDDEIDTHDNEENDSQLLPRSEVLPGFRPNSNIYHDGRGYYFIFNAHKENKRYLRCIEPRCRVRGSMRLYDGAPIYPSANAVHNHRPDFRRKDFVLFLKRCKERAVSEELKSVIDIYNEEAEKDPVSAGMISYHNLIQRMTRARKGITKYLPTEEDHSEFIDACKSEQEPTAVPEGEVVDDNEDSRSQDESYHDIVAEAVTDDEVVDDDTETDAIEKAISELTTKPVNSEEEFAEDGGPVPEHQLQPSETLPGIRPHSTLYYDPRGYYYIYNTQRENIWYLKCVESQCRVRAHMAPKEGSPIIQSPNSIHNHQPDFKRKQLLLWMERAKQRAVSEHLPIPTIYAQEAARDPVSAGLVSEDNMKTRLYRARKLHLKGSVDKAHEVVEIAKEAPLEETVIEGNDQLAEHTMVMVTDAEFANGEEQQAVITIQAEDAQHEMYSGSSYTVSLLRPPTIPQRPTFCDEKGYCYQQTTIRNSTRYLRCIDMNCRARASMTLEINATIVLNKQTPQHNHEPDQSEYMIVESGQLDTPIQVIYTDEQSGEQIALCHVPDDLPKRPYKQRQKPDITIDPEELVDPNSTSASDVDQAGGDYYHNEDQQQYPLKPSEVIPGLRPDANNYHDGNGFYYELNRLSQNIRYLKCLIKDCRARAYMEVGKKNAPIIQTNFAKHNHGPDLFRKQFTVFLHRVTRRAAEEDTPINVIYQQEAQRDPQSASQIRMENVKQRMLRYRKKHRMHNPFYHIDNATGTDADLEPLSYTLQEGEKDNEEYPAGTYYVVEGEEEGGLKMEVQEVEEGGLKMEVHEVEEVLAEVSPYQGYVVSEVEVESSSQHLM